MNRKRLIIYYVILLILFTSRDVWSWAARAGINDHGKLAVKAEQCLNIPKPSQKRCEKSVDDDVLYNALKKGAAEPDIKDGETTTKHSYNPAYNEQWDPAIAQTLGLSFASIGPGDALTEISSRIKDVNSFLQTLTCDSTQRQYVDIWKQFGILSHR